MPLPGGDSMQGQSTGTHSVGQSNFVPDADISKGRVSEAPSLAPLVRSTSWSNEQLANAATILAVGRHMGMSTRDIQIALITAITESNLINVNYGDRDSLGLFQQRPSAGWGTPAQVTNPHYAAAAFFVALRGLGEKRFSMGMGEAAQAVQRSAFPDRYATHIKAVRRMWPLIQEAGGEHPQTLEGHPYHPDGGRGDATQHLLDTSPYVGNVTTGAEFAAGQTGAPAPIVSNPGLEDPAVREAGATAYGTGGALTPIQTKVTPTVEQMLGAWGMSNPTVQQPEPQMAEPLPAFGGSDPFAESAAPIISPATNASHLQQLQEESHGDFVKGIDGRRKAVIAAARTALGTPYTWGGNSLQSGVDCSGLVQQAFAKAGITMPRVSYMQAGRGQRVGLDALRPGDLVAWDNSSRNNGADHIAIYIGNGQIIEAARPGTAVRIRSVSPDEGAWGVHLNI